MDNQEGLDMVTVKLVTTGQIGSNIHTCQDAVHLVGGMLGDLDRESLCVINLRTNGTPINVHIVSIGGINSSPAYPALIVKSAILSNAANMIVLHNHPSGDVNPSMEDKEITERIHKTCKLVGIDLLDHIIVGEKICYSFYTGETMLIRDYDMAPDRKQNQKLIPPQSFTEVLEKYFLTPAKEGFTYEDRLQEGYKMLDMIAEDIDGIGENDLSIQDCIRQLAAEEGILETKQIPVIQHNLRKGR